MIVTKDNIDNITYFEGGFSSDNANKMLLHALLQDTCNLNDLLDKNNKSYKRILIDYIDEHTEYSPERTDPCPDYYGLFKIVLENDHYNIIGDPVGLRDLDMVLCALFNFESIEH